MGRYLVKLITTAGTAEEVYVNSDGPREAEAQARLQFDVLRILSVDSVGGAV